MATRLHQVLTFAAVAPGGIVTLPHSLNVNSVAVLPDFIFRDNGDFTVLGASTTDITVQNNGAGVGTLNAWLFVLHTIERDFGASAVTNLSPQPFIPAASGSGGGGGSSVITFRYVATGGESDFLVTLPFARLTDTYNVVCTCQGVTIIPSIDLPDTLPADRTTTQFRCITSFPLTAGDQLAFFVSD
jgi:hypothetical protein